MSIENLPEGGVRGFWYGLHTRGLILYSVHTNKSKKIHVCFLLRTPLIIKTAVLTCTWKYTYPKEGNSSISSRFAKSRRNFLQTRGTGRRPNWDIAFWWNGREGRIKIFDVESTKRGRTRRRMGLMTRRVEPEINNQNWTTVCETLVINYFIKKTDPRYVLRYIM